MSGLLQFEGAAAFEPEKPPSHGYFQTHSQPFGRGEQGWLGEAWAPHEVESSSSRNLAIKGSGLHQRFGLTA